MKCPAMLFLALPALMASPRLALGQLLDAKVISLDAARTMAAAAEAAARRENWNVAIAIVDVSGGLILFHRMDNVQAASLDFSVAKARTAARFRRPTRALDSAVTAGRTVLLAVDGMLPIEGGVPIEADGKVIGAIGVSGVTSAQDALVARAGAAALKP